MDRSHLATRYRLIPNLVSAVIYRLGIDDAVRDKREVRYVRYKDNGVTETATDMGPVRRESSTVHLYEPELGGWVVQENDVLHVFDVKSSLDVWLRVSSVSRNLMYSRYVCQCVPTLEVGS
jgi:hypothetical protein